MTDLEWIALGWGATTFAYFVSSLHFLRAQSRYRRGCEQFRENIAAMQSRLYDQQCEFDTDFEQLSRAQKHLQDKNAMLKMHVENLRRANEGLLEENKSLRNWVNATPPATP